MRRDRFKIITEYGTEVRLDIVEEDTGEFWGHEYIPGGDNMQIFGPYINYEVCKKDCLYWHRDSVVKKIS